MSTAKHTCVYMLSMSGGKTPEAHICTGPSPKQHLEALNQSLASTQSTRSRKAVGDAAKWSLCVMMVVPNERRLDVTALKVFWQLRSRKLPNRIKFGVRLATALQLQWHVDSAYVEEMAALQTRQRTIDVNTIVGVPLCRPDETVCFTVGSTTANELTRKAEHRSALELPEFDVVPEVDWEKLGELAVDDPGAPLDVVSQTIQANTLELMLNATDPAQRRSAETVIDNARTIAQGPLARVGIGFKPFELLKNSVDATCRDKSGALDDRLLCKNGDSCYTDISEFRDRPLEPVRLHRDNMCMCGSKTTMARVRVRSSANDQRGRLAYRCSECARTTATSVVLQPSVNALRSRIGEPTDDTSTASTSLRCYTEAFDIPTAQLPSDESVQTLVSNPIPDLTAIVDRVLPQKRKNTR